MVSGTGSTTGYEGWSVLYKSGLRRMPQCHRERRKGKGWWHRGLAPDPGMGDQVRSVSALAFILATRSITLALRQASCASNSAWRVYRLSASVCCSFE